MKLLSVCILRRNNATEAPVILDAAYNLSEGRYNFFTRGTAQKFLAAASRVVILRTAGALSVDCDSEGWALAMHCFVEADGLGVLVAADKCYPPRAAAAMARAVAGDFRAAHAAAAWQGCAEDGGCRLPGLEAALRDWQAPARVDEVEKQGGSEGLPAREVLRPGDVPAAPAWEIDSAAKFHAHFIKATMMHITSGFEGRCCSLT
jgi:hypothetical protein